MADLSSAELPSFCIESRRDPSELQSELGWSHVSFKDIVRDKSSFIPSFMFEREKKRMYYALMFKYTFNFFYTVYILSFYSENREVHWKGKT
jgi:hypothetical protein